MNSSNPALFNDPRAKCWGNFVKYAALLTVGFFVAPYIWIAIGGLFGLIVAGLVMGGTWMLRPWLYSVAANMRLALVKSEAAKNPVETLQAEHLRQSTVLEERRKGIETMNGAIRTLDQTIDQLEREFPDSPELPQMRADQAELMSLAKGREEDWQSAYISLGEFAKEIKRVSRIWDVAQAAAKARQQSGLSEDEWLAKLKTETSIESIRSQLNTQLAALSTERMQADADRILKGRTTSKPALPAPDSRPTIDVTPIAAKTRA